MVANEKQNALFFAAYDDYIAKRYYKAISRFKKVLKKDPKIGRAHYYIGCSYECLGVAALAEPHYRKCMEISKEKYGEESPEYATDVHNYGANAAGLGDKQNALLYAQKALSIIQGPLIRPQGISEKQWHKLKGLVAKQVAVLEAKARLGRYEEALQIAKNMSKELYLPSDASPLIRTLEAMDAFSIPHPVNWFEPWVALLVLKVFEVAELEVDFDLTDIGLKHPEILKRLKERAKEIREDQNTRLM